MITFGSVFKHNDDPYIFLCQSEESIYAAKILSSEQSKKLLSFYNITKTSKQHLEHILYSFVILTDKRFAEQIAHFKSAAKGIPDSHITEYLFDIVDDDKQQIFEEIQHNPNIPPVVKTLVDKTYKHN